MAKRKRLARRISGLHQGERASRVSSNSLLNTGYFVSFTVEFLGITCITSTNGCTFRTLKVLSNKGKYLALLDIYVSKSEYRGQDCELGVGFDWVIKCRQMNPTWRTMTIIEVYFKYFCC